MRKLTGLLFLVILSLVISGLTFANLNDFTGTWVNVAPNNGITKIVISSNGGNVMVQAWGDCTPTDCDWGTVQATAYGSNISANLPTAAIALSADFTYQTIHNQLVITKSGNQLRVVDLTTYTDGRSGRYSSYTFNRQLKPIGPIIVPGTIKPIGLGTPQQITPKPGTVFNHYPRTTNLEWSGVQGASYYKVEIQYYDTSWRELKTLGTKETHYTFDFVGAQAGRWRVTAVGNDASQQSPSGWWEFRYTK